MASTIVKTPSGEEIKKDYITAYEGNGKKIILFKTGKVVGETEVFGVSCKNANDNEPYQNFMDDENWNAIKDVIKYDLYDKKENFKYFVVEDSIDVTQNYEHDLALMTAHKDKITTGYNEFLKSQQEKTQETQTINPFATTEIPQVAVQEELSKVEPTPIIEAKEESILPQMNTASPTPVTQEPIMPTPIIENNNMVQFPGNANIVNERQEAIVEQPKEMVANNNDSSAVTKYYADSMNSLVNQLNEVTEKFKDIATKYQATMSEIGNKVVGLLEEINARDEISKQTFDKSQQIIAAQNTDNDAMNLTKAA